ncbi:MAG: DUF2460 domain-containing protein [Rickettsiales bacterium]|nr:DUF2460 domain-containing protein [Rickettsiales bacterium]
MSFAETQFPADISYGSAGGPEFSTDIVVTHGGREQRNSNWSQSRSRYNVAYGVKAKEQMAALITFFRARKGQAEGFRFKDWTDYEAAGALLAIGDASTVGFQLTKSYTSGATTQARIITKPVAATLKLYFDSVLQMTGYALDATTGIVTFESAPASGIIIQADFEFDVPVRFATDRLSSSLDDYGVYSVRDIPLVEVRI